MGQYTTIFYNFGSENNFRKFSGQINGNFWSVLFLVAIFVIYTYQTTAEGEYFAKGDEDGVMDLAQWWAEEAR